VFRASLLLFAFLLAASAAASAQIITCAGNWAQIASAINAASNAGDHDIRVLKGIHVMSGPISVNLHPDAFLKIRGGYDPGCASRDLDPTNTTIAGQGVNALRINHNRDFLLEGLTLRNLGGFVQSFDGALDVSCSATDSNTRFVTVRHNIFSEIDGKYAGVHLWGDGPCRLAFRNNLVKAITAPAGAGYFHGVSLCSGLFDSTRQGDYADQNTFVAINAGAGNQAAALGVCRSGSVSDNVFRGNVPRDLDLSPGNAVDVVDNLYDLAPDDAIGGQNTGNFSADPLFVNAGAGDYRLQLASPAVNHGATMTDLTQDLAGNGRLIGSRTDLGAYETSFNDLTQVLVTTTADSGAGSLRQALLDANANPNHSLVRFAIPGVCGSQGILLLSPLPDITTPVTIDGYTQSGTQPNTNAQAFNAQICVGLTQIGSAPVGLHAVAGSQLVVRGLWFGSFTGSGAAAIRFTAGTGHVVEGVQFSGVLPNATTINGNLRNVLISGGNDLRIGGPAIGQRNLISGAQQQGIAISNAGFGAGVVIQNNLIGTNADRSAVDGNGGAGISVSNSGGVDILGNVINGNDGNGVSISSSSLGVVIRDNEIGRPLQGNQGHGVYVGGGSFSVVIGGSESVNAGGNQIRSNGGAGVWVADGDAVRIRGNGFDDNTLLGIDLGTAGMTPNDPGDGDTGANDLQNYPVLTAAGLLGQQLSLSGTLASGANAQYVIDFYLRDLCDASGHGEGARYLGHLEVSSNGSGQASFSHSIDLPNGVAEVGDVVTATATRQGPTNIGDTSEFSACLAIAPTTDLVFADSFD